MGPKSGRLCLPIFKALSAQCQPLLHKSLQGLGVAHVQEKGHAKEHPVARYSVSSRGLDDLRVLIKWLVHSVLGFQFVFGATFLAGLFLAAFWFLAGATSKVGVANGHLQFRNPLVYSADISGSFHKNDRVLERPRFIPRIVHQTAKSLESLSSENEAIRHTWARMNPGWEVRFWDDAACWDFVRKEFPEYVTAYARLPRNVERADFFRYLVVLRHGGVYADIDTECAQPLDDFIRNTDTLIAGWEGEVGNELSFIDRRFARYRQVQQWWFAGAPEHPALRKVCDHIAEHYNHRFHTHENLDTLDRTGPGPWTDAIITSAAENSPLEKGEGWSVRILPMVATIAHPWVKDSSVGILASMPGVLVMHHFNGSWKVKHGYKSSKMSARFIRWMWPENPVGLVRTRPFSVTPELERYPVSVNLTGTIFTVMVNLVGHGDLQSHEDPSHAITTYGNWQAGMDNTASPRAVVALIGALTREAEAAPSANLSFLDIGAGLGLYSLTAAARGHRVFATELAVRSVVLLKDSIRQNGFEDFVTLHNVTVGEKPGIACVEPDQNDAVSHGWLPEDVQRGFAAPHLHDQDTSQGCKRHVRRVPMDQLVPKGTKVGAMRISAGAWTAAVLRGGLEFLRKQRPAAILIEIDMSEMSRIGENDFLSLLEQLMGMGYRNLGHAGRVCVERFEGMLSALTDGGVRDPTQIDAARLKQPVWCELDASTLPSVLERNRRNGVEKQDPMLAIGVEPILLQLNTSAVAL